MTDHLNQLFFLNREIRVIKLIETFHLAKVKYVDDDTTFFVDINFISNTPLFKENLLSITQLGGIHS